jgi:N-acyl-D-amino-acid deacylase
VSEAADAGLRRRDWLVPGRFAEIDELTGIGAGLGAARAGTFGMNSDFEDETAEFAWITRLAKETGRPVWFLLTDRPTDPERWRRIMAGVHQARAAGASVTVRDDTTPRGFAGGVWGDGSADERIASCGGSRCCRIWIGED